jgi:hypothetical protein
VQGAWCCAHPVAFPPAPPLPLSHPVVPLTPPPLPPPPPLLLPPRDCAQCKPTARAA